MERVERKGGERGERSGFGGEFEARERSIDEESIHRVAVEVVGVGSFGGCVTVESKGRKGWRFGVDKIFYPFSF